MKTMILALAMGAAAALPAMAQTQADTARPSFTGPHVDASIGWNRGSVKDGLPGAKTSRKSGAVFRGSAGYDIGIGQHAIAGAELGIGSGGRNVETVQGTSRFTVDPRFTLDATARVGVKPTENLLIFGKAGWAMQNVRTRLTQAGAPAVYGYGTEHGFLWGGGAEYALSKNVSLRADVDRVKFNEHYARTRLMGGASFRF